MELTYKALTKRRRPHFQPLDANLFVTFRLAGSIPNSVVRYYKAKRRALRNQLRRSQRLAEEYDSPEILQWRDRIERLDRECFIKCEEIMHQHILGPTWLQHESIAHTVAENLHRLDGELYRLDSFSIMSNHVHTVFKPLVDAADIEAILKAYEGADERIPALARIMQAIKGRSARECNLLLGRSGQFWEHESFDHVIRAGRFEKTMRYVLNNPVKAHLVDDWQEYRWNYCREELRDRFR